MSPKILLVCAIFALSYIPKKADSRCQAPCGGCFKDEPSRRALPTWGGSVGSPQQCINICKSKKASYAGIQYGSGCRCGTNYDLYGRAYTCDKKCKNGQDCGGYSTNTVYATGVESIEQKIKDKAEEKAKKEAKKKVRKRIFRKIRRHFW